jgi:hypothetical protein
MEVDKLNVTLSSPSHRCRFEISSEASLPKWFEYLGQRVRIIRSTLNPSLYELHGLSNDDPTFFATSLPKLNETVGIASLSKYDRFIHPESQPRLTVTKESLTRENCYNSVIPSSLIFDAFSLLLPPPTELPPYLGWKSQWADLSRAQFLNAPLAQKLLSHVQSEILRRPQKFEKYSDKTVVQKVLFDLAVTYTISNWDATVDSADLIDLLLPFVDAHIEQYREGNSECEVQVFSVFSVFFEKNGFGDLKQGANPVFVPAFLNQVGQTIQSKFPDLLQVLEERQVYTLDFLAGDLSRWFLDVFEAADLKTLWISALVSQTASAFFEPFVIALLLAALDEMSNLLPLTFDEFVGQFERAKGKLQLGTLLASAKQIADFIHE